MELLRHRAIAFLDVLGFSNRLVSTSLASLHAVHSGFTDHAKALIFDSIDSRPAPPDKNFASARFLFDSAVLVSRPLAHPTAASSFFLATNDLLRLSFGAQMPLRGCIGIGDFLEDAERGLFYSNVMPKLVSAEKEQEWSG